MRAILLVLAGGQGTRMGGTDKPLRSLGGQPLIGHVLARLASSAGATLLSVNAEPERYARFGATVLPDTIDGFPGPLGGVLAGLEWLARHQPDADMLVVPADTPFLPRDLLARLRQARELQGKGLACARSGKQLHPVVGLWRAGHADAVRQALAFGNHGLGQVMQAIGLGVAEFATQPDDPFLNVNTPEDLERAETMCRGQTGRPGALPLDPAKGKPLEPTA